MTTPARRRRVLTALTAVLLGATALVLVPMPRFVEAATFRSTVRTQQVELALHRGLGTGAVLSAAAAAESAVTEAVTMPQRRRATVTAPFDALGVTLAAEPTEPVLVRGRVDGTWSPWFEAELLPDEAPDEAAEPTRPGLHSEPIWFGGATAYEIDAPVATSEIAVHLVDDRETGTSRQLAVDSAGALGAPGIRSRASWGARAPKSTPVVSGDLKVAVVHHSVNSNGYTAAQVPALLRSIQAYHQDVQGWNDIAYNFAVDRFGQAWEARAGGIDKVVLGGHSRGFNTGSVGVVVLGDFRAARASSYAVEAVSRVIAWKLALHRVSPTSSVPFTTTGSGRFAAGTTVRLPRIVGHRDLQTTSCPGAGLYGQLGTIRNRVAQLVPQYQAGLPSQLVGLDLGGNGLEDAFEHRLGPSTDTRWVANGLGGFTKSTTTIVSPLRPVVGDFDGNGRDDVLWHGSGTTPDRIWWSGGTAAQTIDVKGSYVPMAGDFDGDGRDDVLWYAPGIAPDAVWYGRSDRTFAKQTVHQDLIAGVPVVGDFDGNGRDDVFFYGRRESNDVIWWSNGRTWRGQAMKADGYYTVAAVHDGLEGRDEILLVSPTASSYRWSFSASRTVSSRQLGTGVDGVPTVGDFDGNGLEDVLLLARNGASALWFMTPNGAYYYRDPTVAGASAVSGRMQVLSPRDQLLLVSSSGIDERWAVGTDRSLVRSRVG